MSLASTLRNATQHDIAFIDAERRWMEQARGKQVLPIGGWSQVLAQAGRGWGKTQTGSSLVRRWVGLYPGCVIHVVAPTQGDLRGVLFNGVSGLIAAIPAIMILKVDYQHHEIHFVNGCLLRGFSAEAPDRLRGPQCTFCWGDEIASWGNNAAATLANIDFSTRIAHRGSDGTLVQPQKFYTTTPRPLAWLKKLAEQCDWIIRGSTYENRANLAKVYLDKIAQYEGTQIGRQEIHGELLDISEAAIIKRSWLNLWSNEWPLPWFDFIMVSMDTAFTEKTFDKKEFTADPTACQVWGVFTHNRRWNVMLLECWSDQLGFPQLVERAKKELKVVYGRRSETLFQPVVGQSMTQEQEKRPDLLIIEDKGSGISLRQMLSQEGIDSWPFNPGNADKLSRLHAISHVGAAGRVWLPESTRNKGEPRDWIEPMLDEVCVYSGPGTTTHDDHVDTFSQAMRYFADRWLNTGVNEIIKPDGTTMEVNIDPDDIPPAFYNDQVVENYYDA